MGWYPCCCSVPCDMCQSGTAGKTLVIDIGSGPFTSHTGGPCDSGGCERVAGEYYISGSGYNSAWCVGSWSICALCPADYPEGRCAEGLEDYDTHTIDWETGILYDEYMDGHYWLHVHGRIWHSTWGGGGDGYLTTVDYEKDLGDTLPDCRETVTLDRVDQWFSPSWASRCDGTDWPLTITARPA